MGHILSKIIIRIDDVLKTSSDWSGARGPEHRFTQVCRWVYQAPVEFIPAILCKDIMAFPSTVDRIKHDAIDGIIKPAIHGWEHIDYNALSDKDVREHLSNCISWFRDYLWYTPTLWCTPWGADSPKLREIAGEFGLTVEGTAGWVEPGEWLQHAREGRLDPRLMWHWWERGQKLLKVVEVIKAGSYKEAAKTRLDLFG